MKITTKFIESLNPCKDRFDNFKLHYPNFKGSIFDFLDLTKITYDDKIWVAKKLLTKTQAVEWACQCAESVLDLFESKHLNDPYPRIAIQVAINPDSTQEEKDAAYAAAAADASYAAHAASYAAEAAAYAAYAADAAADASYAADAATTAAYASGDAGAREKQQDKNIQFLKNAFTF